MSKRSLPISLVFLVVASVALAGEPPRKSKCEMNPVLVAPCFVVHGTIRFSYPYLLLYEKGSGRVFRIWNNEAQLSLDPEYPTDMTIESDLLPDNVGDALSQLGHGDEIEGDFKVCPFTLPFDRSFSREDQFVCIASGSSPSWKKVIPTGKAAPLKLATKCGERAKIKVMHPMGFSIRTTTQ